jgi:hypothetical protein
MQLLTVLAYYLVGGHLTDQLPRLTFLTSSELPFVVAYNDGLVFTRMRPTEVV